MASPDPPDYYAITGIQTGKPQLRQDIDDWYLKQTADGADRIQLTLFVEALITIQARFVDDELSYFRLAGIHAAPWTSWDNVSPTKDGPNKFKSFCRHRDYTFPTWHRVYVALFEQVVHIAMLEYCDKIADASLKKKKKWKGEADKWRLPYWDFARFATNGDHCVSDELSLPILATMPEVMVRALGSEDLVAKPNPLYKFETRNLMGQLRDPFTITDQKDDPEGITVTLPFSKCKSTTKYGLMEGYHPEIWANGGQNWQLANVALNEYPHCQNKPDTKPIPTLQDKVYRLLVKSDKSWEDFSSTKDHKDKTRSGDANNLEDIHNSVHNFVGGFLFDRHGRPDDLKLWGSGHMSCVPVAAFDPIFWLHHCNVDRLTVIWQSLNDKTWFAHKSCAEDHLEPFHKKDGTSFTSNDVRYWTNLGYDYAIIQNSQKNMEEEIMGLYGNVHTVITSDTSESDHGDHILFIKYDRYALKGSPFQINIFFGDVDGKDFYDKNSENFVGSVFNFSSNIQQSNCGNCIQQQQAGGLSVAQLPATLALSHYLDPDKSKGDYPEVYYVVVNSLGQAVNLEVDVVFYGSEFHFSNPGTGKKGKGDYLPKKKGKSYYPKIHKPLQASLLSTTSLRK